jgi:Transposase DNA-binding/Transposase Tn5 dimerisation domain
MHQITTKDFPGLELGDKRRNERFVSIINNISKQPGSSIPKYNESWYDTKATYEFFKNEDVCISALQKAIELYGGSKVEGLKKVLVAHDFCQISYNNLQSEGLGYLANKDGRGIITYNSIAISEDGIPLSLLHQDSFTRPLEELGKSKQRKETAFEDKESYHWYKGITGVNEQLGRELQKIHIADREADIFDLFFCAYETNTDLLIRAKHNRKLNDGSALWDTVAKEEEAVKIELKIPDKTGSKRVEITVEVRYQNVEILRPKDSGNQYESVCMSAIELKQVSPKQEWQEELLHWKLLTTLIINQLSDALQCVKWYCYRWLIERFHYVLKSGTKIEELQLERASSLQKAIHVYSIAAMRIMQLVYQSRQTPNVSCEVVLTKQQWAVLYMLIHKTKILPEQPPTLGEAVKWIGRLGGHLGRKSDGPPGLKTVWLGYQRVCDAASVYEIMAPS